MDDLSVQRISIVAIMRCCEGMRCCEDLKVGSMGVGGGKGRGCGENVVSCCVQERRAAQRIIRLQ